MFLEFLFEYMVKSVIKNLIASAILDSSKDLISWLHSNVHLILGIRREQIFGCCTQPANITGSEVEGLLIERLIMVGVWVI